MIKPNETKISFLVLSINLFESSYRNKAEYKCCTNRYPKLNQKDALIL